LQADVISSAVTSESDELVRVCDFALLFKGFIAGFRTCDGGGYVLESRVDVAFLPCGKRI
jgi:hypothetical protein